MVANVVIIGGHGKISLRLARLLSTAGNQVTSVIRTIEQSKDIEEVGATPFVLSLEDDTPAEFTKLFLSKSADVVYFSAGAGGKGGEERTKKVDYEGAIKTFDAIDGVKTGGGTKNPRLILVSAVDIRNPEKIPEHYNEDDKRQSERIRQVIPAYMHWKYEADKNLVERKTFEWTIVRPGGLTDKPGTGNASIGRTHLSPTISRDDIALALSLLVNREDAAGLAVDLVGGDTPIQGGLDTFIEKGVTDWLG